MANTLVNAMNLDTGNLIELTIATIGGLGVIGLTVLKFAIRGMEQQHEITRKMIDERFQWAEAQRQESREHWDNHFDQLKVDDDRMSQRIGQIEVRVTAIELHLSSQANRLDQANRPDKK